MVRGLICPTGHERVNVAGNNKTYFGHYVKYLTRNKFCYTDFHKIPNIKFHVHPSSGTRPDTCGRTDGENNSLIPFQLKGLILRQFDVACNNKFMPWNFHFEEIIPKLNKACFTIRSLRPNLPYEVVRMIYFSYFRFIMSFGIIFWGNLTQNNFIYKIQKRKISPLGYLLAQLCEWEKQMRYDEIYGQYCLCKNKRFIHHYLHNFLLCFVKTFFNNFSVLKCGCESVFKRSAWVGFE
jgi:hypothetical protein